MEKNIFEGAKFGDKFLTRDGTIAIYIASHTETSIYNNSIKTIEHTYALPNRCTVHWCKDDGTNCNYQKVWDIVSRYQEPIDEDKLDELAYNKTNENVGENRYEETDLKRWYGFRDGFKAGYRKAMEEK